MKKLIFTLMMMAGLALVAGTAMAVNETSVLAGNTYSYSLTSIVLTEEATATVVFEGTNQSDVTIYEAGTTNAFSDVTMSTTADGTFSFDIEYDETITDNTATDDSIKVTITYNGTSSSCSNIIKYGIDILPPPTYTLAITVDKTSTCQERTGTGHNLADARGGETGDANTITFTVSPEIQNVPNGADFTFTYDIIADLPATITNIAIAPTVGTTGSPETISTNVTNHDGTTYTTGVTHVLTFETTTGVDSEDIIASLESITTTASLTVDDGGTGGEYFATSGGAQSVTTTISAVPTMGSFVQ